MTLHSLPIFVRLSGRAVILVGEGEAAAAKRRLLERAGAVILTESERPASPGDDPRLAIVVDDEPAVARLKARGILVNAVAPGVVETAIIEGVPDAVRSQWHEKTPIGRLGKPEEIASVVAFLASDDASYVTGQTIIADGGATTGDY